jgi:hypothetical protein
MAPLDTRDVLMRDPELDCKLLLRKFEDPSLGADAARYLDF